MKSCRYDTQNVTERGCCWWTLLGYILPNWLLHVSVRLCGYMFIFKTTKLEICPGLMSVRIDSSSSLPNFTATSWFSCPEDRMTDPSLTTKIQSQWCSQIPRKPNLNVSLTTCNVSDVLNIVRTWNVCIIHELFSLMVLGQGHFHWDSTLLSLIRSSMGLSSRW